MEIKFLLMATLVLALRACEVRWDNPAFWVAILAASVMGALP